MSQLKKQGGLTVKSNSYAVAYSAENAYSNRTRKAVVNVLFELTYDCSEQCIHCYNPGATRNNTEKNHRHQFSLLTWEDIKRGIDECYDEGMVRVCLSGGDPFSNPHAWKIIEYLYEKEIAFEIYTNGQNLIGNEERLASYFPCDVGLSIYSADSKVHDYITRVCGSWEKTMTVMERLSELSVPLELKCCIMKPNLASYYPLEEIARKYSASLQLQSILYDSMDGDHCVSKHLRLSPEEMEISFCDINNSMYVGSEVEEYGAVKVSLDNHGCHAGFGTFCITPTGDFVLCSSFYASLGNIRRQSVHDIILNPQLRKWQQLLLESYEECGRHDYCSFCQICPGLNFAEHGTPLKASENNCYVAKIRFNLANKLRRGENPLNGKPIEQALEDIARHWQNSIKLKRESETSHYCQSLNL